MTESIILFIDDDPGDYKPIKGAFKRAGNESSLRFVSTGEEALELVGKETIKALFVKESLPDMKGFELLERLKKLKIHMPVIVMMREDDRMLCLTAIRKGANDCVVGKKGHFSTFPCALDRAVARFELDAERMEQERVVKKSRQLWMAILDGIRDYIFIIDSQDRIFSTNRSLAQFFDKHPKDLIGRNLMDVFGEDFSFILFKSMRGDLPQTEEKTIRGETYLISSFPLHYDSTPLTICVMKNISEMRRLKEQLYHSYKMASLGLLISGIAHEINNPLAGIMTYAELLRIKTGDEEIGAGLKKILNGANRCKRVIENLLTFSRQRVPSKSLESINDVIDRTVELRSYWLRQNNIDVIKKYSETPAVLLDSQQLQQVFLNILMNAEQAITGANIRNGRITVATKYDEENGKIIVRVSDNGPGVPKDIISSVFDPFFTTKPIGTGTGLGLSIAHGIITEHGGKIWVESPANKGASFFIELPRSMQYEDKSYGKGTISERDAKSDNSKNG